MALVTTLNPRAVLKTPDTVRLADMMPALLAAALEGASKFLPLQEEDGSTAESTYDYCRQMFGEEYTDDVKSMMDSFDANPVTIAISGNGTGKTHGAARIAVATVKRFKDAKVYTAAAPPEDNLKRLLWGEIGSVVQKFRKLFSKAFWRVSLAGMHIARQDNDSCFLTGVTIPNQGTDKEREARFSGKHAPVIVFIVDEADAVPYAVYKGIESCLSGGWARLLLLFNPRHQSGPVYQMIRDGAANVVTLTAFNHPNVITGEDIFPGAVDRNTTGRRILRWTTPLRKGELPDKECFQVPDFFEGFIPIDFSGKPMKPIKGGQWRRVIEPSFFYMVLAMYPTMSENQLIDRVWIERAQDKWRELVEANGEAWMMLKMRPKCGLDVAEFGVDKSVFTSVHGSFCATQEEWNGVDPLVTGDKAAKLSLDRNARWTNVDSTGVGAGVPPAMRRAGFRKAHRIMFSSSPPDDELSEEQKELGVFGNLRDMAWWSIREWLRNDPNAALPPDPLLEEELLVATYQPIRGVIKVLDSDSIREKIRRSADHATSLGLALMGEVVTQEDGAGEFRSGNYIKGGRKPAGNTGGKPNMRSEMANNRSARRVG